MKRLLLLLLATALVWPGAASATGRGFLREWEDEEAPGAAPTAEPPEDGTETPGAEEPFHTLWGIPFGITGDEAYERVLEETGLKLQSGTDQWGDQALLSTSSPQPEMLGYPVRLSFSLDDRGLLHRIAIQFEDEDEYMLDESFPSDDDLEDGIVRLLEAYDGVHDALMARYGTQQGGLLAVEGPEREMVFYDYPGAAWGLDMRMIARVAMENPYCAFVTRYGNVIETGILHTQQIGGHTRVRVQMMLMLFPSADGYREIAPNMPEMKGFATPNGVYQYKAVDLGL